jgi:hypothetical protein
VRKDNPSARRRWNRRYLSRKKDIYECDLCIRENRGCLVLQPVPRPNFNYFHRSPLLYLWRSGRFYIFRPIQILRPLNVSKSMAGVNDHAD